MSLQKHIAHNGYTAPRHNVPSSQTIVTSAPVVSREISIGNTPYETKTKFEVQGALPMKGNMSVVPEKTITDLNRAANIIKEQQDAHSESLQKAQRSIVAEKARADDAEIRSDWLERQLENVISRITTLEAEEVPKDLIRQEVESLMPAPLNSMRKRDKVRMLGEFAAKGGVEFALYMADLFGWGWLARIGRRLFDGDK